MTVNVTLPTAPQPYLEAGLLPADFYSYEELLSDSERAKVARIREFFRTEAAPCTRLLRFLMRLLGRSGWIQKPRSICTTWPPRPVRTSATGKPGLGR